MVGHATDARDSLKGGGGGAKSVIIIYAFFVTKSYRMHRNHLPKSVLFAGERSEWKELLIATTVDVRTSPTRANGADVGLLLKKFIVKTLT